MQLRTSKTGASYVLAMHVLIVCASTTFTPTARMKVVLPDIFDPVTSTPRPGESAIVLGTGSSSSGWATLVRIAAEPGRGRVQSLRSARHDATPIAASTSPIAAVNRSNDPLYARK